MDSQPLEAHSISEIHLYLAVTACDACGGGPLECGPETRPASDGFLSLMQCASCGHKRQFAFTLPAGEQLRDRDALYPTISLHDEPSKIIDVGQWITLFRVRLEASGREDSKIESRRLGLEAAQCLEEAIKFYDDNELPPDEAVFCDSTRTRLREHPEQFARQRLVDMRAKLPALSRDTGSPQRKRPWWRFWSR